MFCKTKSNKSYQNPACVGPGPRRTNKKKGGEKEHNNNKLETSRSAPLTNLPATQVQNANGE
jgi:hypothetical protein